MFLFRERQLPATNAPDARYTSSGGVDCVGSGSSEADSAGGQREFLAFKAVRFLGNKARQVGSVLAKVTSGPTTEGLRTELESRALASRESLAAAVAEWGPLLLAPDDTPRYEAPGGGQPMTFRAAFLFSRAFELALAAAGTLPLGAPASGSGVRDVSPRRPEVCNLLDSAGWRSFLRGAALPGGEAAAAELPDLLEQSRHFPDCRRWVEEAVLAIKADAKTEQLRTERSSYAARAEALRATLRGTTPSHVSSNPSRTTSEAVVLASREAVGLYAVFRSCLVNTITHLREQVLAARQSRLRMAQETLHALGAEAECRRANASARHDEVLRQRDEALAEPRRQIEALERDSGRFEADERGRLLEEKRRQLQMQLEDASQELAVQRDARLQLLRRRETAVAEHRQRREAAEQQLRDLLPSQFHRAIGARAVALTEGEIVAGLNRTTETTRSIIASTRAAAEAAVARRDGDLLAQVVVVEKQTSACLLEHAELERTRLETAGNAALSAAAALLDGSRSRAAYAAMGLPPEEQHLPSRRDVRRLRRALAQAEDAWQEADKLWAGSNCSVPEGATSSRGGDCLRRAITEEASSALASLELARGRIQRGLEQLRAEDPDLYELVVEQGNDDHYEDENHSPHRKGRKAADHFQDDFDGGAAAVTEAEVGGEADADCEADLPHGWEAHLTENNEEVYYYSLVTGETQWEVPEEDAAVVAGWQLFQADDGNWFYHNAYDGNSMWYPELPAYAAGPLDS